MIFVDVHRISLKVIENDMTLWWAMRDVASRGSVSFVAHNARTMWDFPVPGLSQIAATRVVMSENLMSRHNSFIASYLNLPASISLHLATAAAWCGLSLILP